MKNPDGKKIDCERDTGLSRHTVLKMVVEKIKKECQNISLTSDIPFLFLKWYF